MRRLAVLLVLLLAFRGVAALADDDCGIDARYVTPVRPLPALAAAIAAHQPVRLLAAGSGATAGGGSVQATEAYPVPMLAALRAALPGTEVTLSVRGGLGMTATDLLPLIQTALREAPPTVVVWQTGTVEAIKAMRPDRLRAALEAGLAATRAAGADLVLVDPLFSRAVRANADLEPYEAELQRVGAMAGSDLFRRFELTRGWVTAGRIDPERAPAEARVAVLHRLNRCVGQALALYLLRGAGVTPP